jgi:hypothetical protein
MTTHSSTLTHEVSNTPLPDTSVGRYRVRSDFFGVWVIVAALLLALAIASSFLTPFRLPTDDDITRAALHTPHERGIFDRN